MIQLNAGQKRRLLGVLLRDKIDFLKKQLYYISALIAEQIHFAPTNHLLNKCHCISILLLNKCFLH